MIDDEITISKPDGFSGRLEEIIAFENRPRTSFEDGEYKSAHDAYAHSLRDCLIAEKYENGHRLILPKKLVAPRNKMPENIYGHPAQLSDELGDEYRDRGRGR